ncbi:MAG TPA: GntR family transcriptional regulator, partial [Devosiaceae bacterium]
MSLMEPVTDTSEWSARPETGDQSLSEQAYGRILEQILTGKIPPGTLLQERRIAGSLSMSRTPVREALGRLEAESLITRSHGRAPVVSNVGVETFVSILDVRRVLEVEAAGRATGHVQRDVADHVIAAIDELLAMEDPAPAQHWAVDDLVHGTIADAAGNPLLASTIRDLRRRTQLFNTTRISSRLKPGGSEHMKLMGAVMGDDRAFSRAVMGDHLDNVRD